MRSFRDGETITLEPFRAKSFPVLKDLIVDRTSFESIIQERTKDEYRIFIICNFSSTVN